VTTQFAGDGRATLHVDLPGVGTAGWLDRISGTVKGTVANATALETPVERLDVHASVASGLATVRTLDVTSANFKMTAAGTVALNDAGVSDLTYDITASDLSKLPPVISAHVAGSVHAAGRLTGPFSRMSTSGTLQAHEISARSVSALTLEGAFDATVVNRDFANARGKFTGAATFVEARGTRIDRVQAALAYDAGTLDVDATLDQRTRMLQFAGSLVPHADHREVHIRALAATAGSCRPGGKR
jgi:autotransporter translocation and assembly factor TamB